MVVDSEFWTRVWTPDRAGLHSPPMFVFSMLIVLAGTAEPALGVRLRPLLAADKQGAPVAEGGVVIDAIYEESTAARAGLRSGDVLLSVDGQAVPFPHVLGQVLAKRRIGDEVRLEVWREAARVEARATLGTPSEELTAGCEKKSHAPSCAALADLVLRGSGVERDP